MFILIATKTVLPTLKSAREYCSKPRTPQIIKSGDFDTCYDRAISISGGRLCHDKGPVLNGAPVFVTGDWTYNILKVP